MTKAKEALDLLIALEGQTQSDLQEAFDAWLALFSKRGFVYECKKGLELRDKVERGGESFIEYCQGKPHEVASFISNKYILIPKE